MRPNLFTTRILLGVAAVGLAGALPASAQLSNIDFEGANYPVGPLVTVNGGGMFTNTNGWQFETAGQAAGPSSFNISGTVHSPIGGGSQSLAISHTIDARRVGVDFANPITTGVVRFQYDILRANAPIRIMIDANTIDGDGPDNIYGNADDQTAPNSRIFGQLDVDQAGAWFGFFGRGGFGINFTSLFVNVTGAGGYYNNPQPYPPPQNFPGRWYRVSLYFDLDNMGRLIYGELFDISCPGGPVKIGEHHVDFQTDVITQYGDSQPFSGNPGAQNAITGFQVRIAGTAGAGEITYLDNVQIQGLGTLGSGYILPTATQIPPPPPPGPRPPDRTATYKVGAVAFTLPAPIGNFASMAYASSNSMLYTLDAANHLQKVNMAAPVPAAVQLDDASEMDFVTYDQPTSVMAVSADGSTLYVLANNLADPANPPMFPWRDLSSYPTAATNAGFTLVASGDTLGGQIGDHAVSLLTVGGVRKLYHAWSGASFYASLNANGSVGPGLNNVGNRWAGATTEAFADGAVGSTMFYLQQTDADGNPISNNSQAYNAIYSYNAGITGEQVNCGGQTQITRLSPSAQVLPWTTRAADGPDVNRHTMEYVPQAGASGRIWIARAAGTPHVGVYDIATDTWGTLTLLDNTGGPLDITKGDIQLVGNTMLAMTDGRSAVYSFDALTEGTPVGPPPNDNCADAMPVGEGAFPFSTTFATTDGPEESCFSAFGGNFLANQDVWFRYTASRAGTATASLCSGTAFDTVMGISNAAGGCPQPFQDQTFACGDDDCNIGGGPSEVSFPVTAGSQWYIRIGGWADGNTGTGVLTISLPSACPCDFNNSGIVNSQDFFDFLNCFFNPANCPAGTDADFNNDNIVNSQDFFDFLNCFFNPPVGC